MPAQITSFSPEWVFDSTTSIVINGTGFSGTPGRNTVLMDGISATVTGDTPTAVTFTKPGGVTKDVFVTIQVENLDDPGPANKPIFVAATDTTLKTGFPSSQEPGPLESFTTEVKNVAEAKDYMRALAILTYLRDVFALTEDLLVSDSDMIARISGSPAAISIAASRIVARLAAGDVGAKTIQEVLSLLLTTKGDLAGFTTTPVRIPVGTDGQLLEADSGEAAGVKWADAVASGKILQFAFDEATGVISTTADMLWDNTPPTTSDGAEWASISGFTPISGTSKIMIRSTALYGANAGQEITTALFVPAEQADAYGVAAETAESASRLLTIPCTAILDSWGAATARDVTARFGRGGSATVYVNAENGAGRFSTVPKSYLWVWEIAT